MQITEGKYVTSQRQCDTKYGGNMYNDARAEGAGPKLSLADQEKSM